VRLVAAELANFSGAGYLIDLLTSAADQLGRCAAFQAPGDFGDGLPF
jgi:hypothetical protein